MINDRLLFPVCATVAFGLLSGCDSKPVASPAPIAATPPAPPPPPTSPPPPSQTQNLATAPATIPPTTNTPSNSSTSPVQDSPARIRSGNFSFNARDGFVPRDKSLYHEKLRATLQFAHSPAASFNSTAAEFTPTALEQQGLKLVTKDDVQIDGAPGILVHVERQSKPQDGYILVFDTRSGVGQVTMIFPRDTPENDKKSFRDSMLTMRYDP